MCPWVGSRPGCLWWPGPMATPLELEVELEGLGRLLEEGSSSLRSMDEVRYSICCTTCDGGIRIRTSMVKHTHLDTHTSMVNKHTHTHRHTHAHD